MTELPTAGDQPIKPEDFAFSVTDHVGRIWDVYHFTYSEEGTQGTIAFRFDERLQQWIIGIMEAFWLDKGQVLNRLLTR